MSPCPTCKMPGHCIYRNKCQGISEANTLRRELRSLKKLQPKPKLIAKPYLINSSKPVLHHQPADAFTPFLQRQEAARQAAKGNPHICWLLNTKGVYANAMVNGTIYPAHRVAYYLSNKDQDMSGKVVMHLCNHRACVNPHHLYLGTHKENMEHVSLTKKNPEYQTRDEYPYKRWG